MENKYFTPDVLDIYVGYELEWKAKIRHQDWEKTICDVDLISIIYDQYEHADDEEPFNEQFRVPYLTKEQIEAEGWKLQNILLEDDDGNDMFSTGFTKTIDEHHWYELVLQEDNKLFIQYKWYRNSVTQLWRTIYYGKCKDINTFRKICKLLEI